MIEPTMHSVAGKSLQLNVAEWDGGGETLLALHGITANCRCWDRLAGVLTPRHRLLAMDLRGRGRSDKPDQGYEMAHHIDDINSSLDHFGLRQAVLVGHSLGAFIALAFAAEHPERVSKVILIDGGGKLSAKQFDAVLTAIKPALDRLGQTYPSTKAYMAAMRASPYLHPWSPFVECYYRYEIEAIGSDVETNINPAHIAQESANLRRVDVAALYPRVACEVLILRATKGLLGPEDLLLPEPVIRNMIQTIGHAERFDVEGVNHYGVVFQPHEARDQAILEFLKQN